MFTFVTTIVNCALTINTCLNWMTRPKVFQDVPAQETGHVRASDIRPNLNVQTTAKVMDVLTKLGKLSRFPKYLSKYRQLQIIATVTNQFCSFVIPIGMFVAVVVCPISGYFIIKLSGRIPFPLTLLSIFAGILTILAAHAIIPLGSEVTSKCESFIKFWKLQGFSGHKKRQLASLKPLAVTVGPFFLIRKGTRGEFLAIMLYYTASLVISI